MTSIVINLSLNTIIDVASETVPEPAYVNPEDQLVWDHDFFTYAYFGADNFRCLAASQRHQDELAAQERAEERAHYLAMIRPDCRAAAS